MIDEITVKILVTGTVQGVGFRWATRRVAMRMNIAGYVKNLYNGQVKVIAQGTNADVIQFIKAIRASPTPYGHVSHVQVRKIHRVPYSLFIVK